jgi:hypothetical protein
VKTHLIGLLLGTEEDWPTVFETLVPRIGAVDYRGGRHSFTTERVTIEPFRLRYRPRHALVIDRLAYWYYQPREWLKKVALMDDVYLLNNPFTFQSMEKHAAYCAMMRLGMRVPETWLLPHKKPLDNPRWPYTTAKYNRPFDLDAVAEAVGYPLYMKPFDGGQWVGVTRISDSDELHARYDESGQRLMHLQAALEDFEVFARSLSIGPETMVMRFEPHRAMHDRYRLDHDFLSADLGREIVTIGKVVNAFFRWEFNSCETILKDGVVYPIDYANAWPDVALTSLHYYFPWAMRALLRWCLFCCAAGRRMKIDMETTRYFELADRDDLGYEEKLERYRTIADEHFQAEEYAEFCATQLAQLDELVVEYFESPDWDRLLVEIVRSTFPTHEYEHFVEHYRGLVAAWARDQRAVAA